MQYGKYRLLRRTRALIKACFTDTSAKNYTNKIKLQTQAVAQMIFFSFYLWSGFRSLPASAARRQRCCGSRWSGRRRCLCMAGRTRLHHYRPWWERTKIKNLKIKSLILSKTCYTHLQVQREEEELYFNKKHEKEESAFPKVAARYQQRFDY